MKSPRIYGKAPRNIVTIHGGPGAAGEMTPVSNELADEYGVLEPFQTEKSIEGQIKELKDILDQNGKPPFILIGFSWGAWLSFIFASRHSTILRKLIIIGSGPFEEKYKEELHKNRLSRLNDKEKKQLELLPAALNDPSFRKRNHAFAEFGKLFSKIDNLAAIDHASDTIDFNVDIYQSVWPEAAELRKSGKLLSLGKDVKCPVVAIHGDYDPHPAKGVSQPLNNVLRDFKFILIKKCGHKPWMEQFAKNKFYKILKEELQSEL